MIDLYQYIAFWFWFWLYAAIFALVFKGILDIFYDQFK